MEFAPGTFQGLHGDEAALFQKVLKGVSGVGVEIGCMDGYSSAVILDASELHLTSIDPFIPDSMEASLIGSKARYVENVKPFGERASLVEDYSEQYAKHMSSSDMPHMCDFVFIDGDHTYDSVLSDFVRWSDWLWQGGLLAMHDARMSREGGAPFHPGPSEVADLMVFRQPEKWEIVGEAFSLVIARKR